MSSPVATIQPITGPGSVAGSPHLPDRFAETFRSVLVDTGDLHLHAVIGGDGPPLLLVGGWPQTWYAWRMVMPALALHHTVVAAEPRGIGLSDKPITGYDNGTLAADSVALMRALGHDRFDMIGHDIGMWIGYALAADSPEALDRLVVMEAAIPGVSPSGPLLGSSADNDKLWHFAFNRLPEVNEQLVRRREHLFFPHQFRSKSARPTAIPGHAVDVYVESLARSDEALRSSFEFYRALDETIAQNTQRMTRRLTLPVLAIAGAANLGGLVPTRSPSSRTTSSTSSSPTPVTTRPKRHPAPCSPRSPAFSTTRRPGTDALPVTSNPRTGPSVKRLGLSGTIRVAHPVDLGSARSLRAAPIRCSA